MTEKLTNIDGSGLDPKVQQKQELVNQAAQGENPPQNPDPAAPTPPENPPKDTKFELPEGFDVKKTPEFKKMRDDLLSKSATLRKDLDSKEQAIQKLTTQVEIIDKTLKDKERENLPDIDKLKATIADQDDKILKLLEREQTRNKQFQEQNAQIQKQKVLEQSELNAEYYEYIHATDPDEIQQQVERLVAKLGDSARKVVEQIKPITTKSEVGSPANNAPNEGIPTGGETGGPKPDFAKMKKEFKDVKDLESFLTSNPEYAEAFRQNFLK